MCANGRAKTLYRNMNPEFPRSERAPTFQEYKRANEGRYSVEHLSHYFNTELGIAANLIGVLRARITALSDSPELTSIVMSQLTEVVGHLTTVHEIANASFDLLVEKDNNS
jgi:hypothetical protein